jgi:hypothetical protein
LISLSGELKSRFPIPFVMSNNEEEEEEEEEEECESMDEKLLEFNGGPPKGISKGDA